MSTLPRAGTWIPVAEPVLKTWLLEVNTRLYVRDLMLTPTTFGLYSLITNVSVKPERDTLSIELTDTPCT
jgi:hypothetical protein